MTIPKHMSLTTKGYVILKSELDKDQEKQIIKDLTVIPTVLPAYKEFVKPKPYKIYFHSDTAYYLPRYYAIEKFGEPKSYEVPIGNKINAKCKFDPMPYQLIADAKLANMFNIKKSPNGAGGVLSLPCGYGKCHGKDTEIMMYDCSIKKVQDIVVGDQLMGDDSKPRNVLSLARGREMMYKIIPSNGTPYTVNESHILSLKCQSTGKIIDILLKDYLKNIENLNQMKGYRVPINFNSKPVPFDPYIMGKYFASNPTQPIPDVYKYNDRLTLLEVLAGIIDNSAVICDNKYNIPANQQINNDILFIARSLGFSATLTLNQLIIQGQGIPTRIIPRISIESELLVDIKIIQLQIDDYYGFTLDGNHRYLLSDFQVTHNTFLALRTICRLGLKALVVVNKECLMDQWLEAVQKFTSASAGILQRDKMEMDNDIVIAMIHSLCLKDYPESMFEGIGMLVLDECFPYTTKIITNKGKVSIGQLYENWTKGGALPQIKSYNETTKCFEFKDLTYAWKKTTDKLVKVHIGKKIVKCTPNHQFLTTKGYVAAQDLTNTSILISHYGTCKVSKIEHINIKQIDVYDIEVADNHNFIVTGANSSDNGVVVHNCHHTSSETFCKALLKVRPLFTLGLSATPERRDGLSHVFYKYIGPLIHKEKREGANQVIVKQIQLTSTSTHYQVLYMSNKTKNTAGMATAISQFPSRTMFLLQILKILISQGRTILVLSSRREHLHDISDLLDSANLIMPNGRKVTYGFYYGKQSANKKQHKLMLDATAKCDIVLGTDAIAKEGLDIPSLNTLLFATPPGIDVEQAGGRILRKYHENLYPMIVDIVDKTGNFGSHATERNKWYKDEQYDIQTVRLSLYDDEKENNYIDPLFKFLNIKLVKTQKLLFDDNDSDGDDGSKKDVKPTFDQCILEPDTIKVKPKSKPKLKTLQQNKEEIFGKPEINPFKKACMLSDETSISATHLSYIPFKAPTFTSTQLYDFNYTDKKFTYTTNLIVSIPK